MTRQQQNKMRLEAPTTNAFLSRPPTAYPNTSKWQRLCTRQMVVFDERDGGIVVEAWQVEVNDCKVGLKVSTQTVASSDRFLFLKTTNRRNL